MESLKTLGKLADVKGNVRATLDKLKGIKADLVRGNQGWQEWSFDDLLGELKKWRDINPVKEKQDSEYQLKETRSTKRSKFYGAQNSLRETQGPSCVYCEEGDHAQELRLQKNWSVSENGRSSWPRNFFASIVRDLVTAQVSARVRWDVASATRDITPLSVIKQNYF